MSMFHELMMRKKEEIMYATIKGTLTENNGVFSGFSASNYLSLSGNVVTDFEIGISFTTGSNVSSQQVIWGQDISSGVQILANGSMKFSVNSAHSTGTEAILTYNLSANTTYKFVALKKSDKSMSLTLYDTLGNILDTASAVSVNNNVNITSFIGRNTGTSYYFKGAVNITKSYIKLGSTKYNLQAVVGYTIVGSPTITDGVVSNLSSSNYLSLPSVDLSNVNKFEINIGFTTNATNSANWSAYIMYFYDGKSRYFGTQYQKKPAFITTNTSYDGNTILSNSKFYKLKYVFTRQNGQLNLDIYLADENNNFTLEGSFENIPDITIANNFKLGTGGTNNNMASLDLNETYIKVNNKLYFNGQQA